MPPARTLAVHSKGKIPMNVELLIELLIALCHLLAAGISAGF
jgi:hypothetical protein